MISRTHVFVPALESGPGGLTVLMHYAFREAMQRMIKVCVCVCVCVCICIYIYKRKSL